MENLTIKELAAYLPYKLQMTRNGFIGELLQIKIPKETDLIDTFEFQVSCSNWWENIEDSSHYKPILHPLSSLTKPITINGETFVPSEWLINQCYFGAHELKRMVKEKFININTLPYCIVEVLLTWKFDIFNLIKRGLAISVTETFNPYK